MTLISTELWNFYKQKLPTKLKQKNLSHLPCPFTAKPTASQNNGHGSFVLNNDVFHEKNYLRPTSSWLLRWLPYAALKLQPNKTQKSTEKNLRQSGKAKKNRQTQLKLGKPSQAHCSIQQLVVEQSNSYFH